MKQKMIGEYSPQWFVQKLDHFHPEDTRVFKQKYYVIDKYFNDDGPVFLYLGGEAPLYGPPGFGSFIETMAEQHGALILSLEHRYYGESIPVDNMSTENLKWLNTRQALLDIAAFRIAYSQKLKLDRQQNGKTELDNKWIVMGGSYAGALSAWFRLKFPHLAIGAVSSSGVVDVVNDFQMFDVQVGLSVGAECAKLLNYIAKELDRRMDESPTSNAAVKAMFGAPGLVDGDFAYMMSDSAAMAVQYGYAEQLCDPLTQASRNGRDVLQTFADYTKNFFFPTLERGGYLEYDCKFLQDGTPDPDRSGRQWWYQKCTELGWMQNAPPSYYMRSSKVNEEYHKYACRTIFQAPLWPDTEAVQHYYGGKAIPATNIMFVNGNQDPWQHASITNSTDPARPARVVKCQHCSHCVDLKPPSWDDDQDLKDARDDIARSVTRFLQSSQ
jgi:pimeloyl-ACP methyl ester carboxylesterase